jgi:DNA primase
MVDEHEPSKNWIQRQNISVPRLNEEPYEAGASAMTLLKLDRVNEAIEAHRQQMYQASQAADEERMRELQNEMMALHQLRKQIEQREYLEWTNAV